MQALAGLRSLRSLLEQANRNGGRSSLVANLTSSPLRVALARATHSWCLREARDSDNVGGDGEGEDHARRDSSERVRDSRAHAQVRHLCALAS